MNNKKEKSLFDVIKSGCFVEFRNGDINLLIDDFYECESGKTKRWSFRINRETRKLKHDLSFMYNGTCFSHDCKRVPEFDIVRVYHVPHFSLVKLIKNDFKYDEEDRVQIVWEQSPKDKLKSKIEEIENNILKLAENAKSLRDVID